MLFAPQLEERRRTGNDAPGQFGGEQALTAVSGSPTMIIFACIPGEASTSTATGMLSMPRIAQDWIRANMRASLSSNADAYQIVS